MGVFGNQRELAGNDAFSCVGGGTELAPYTGIESFSNHPGQRRTAERLRRGREGWVGIGAEIIPKVSSNAGQSLSQPAADSSLCTREPWGRGMRIAASLRSSQ